MKRREFVAGGLFAGLSAAVSHAGVAGAQPARPPGRAPGGYARNVIFFVYDGFGFEDLATSRFFAQRHHGGRVLTLERLLATSAAGNMLTYSLDSMVTDSAAASTAWSTGRKVNNRFVSMLPDGRPLTTVLELARETGRATGLVTTTRITHATPAAWIAKVPHRDLEDEIAAQYLEFRPDVLLGGGSVHFDPAEREDGRDLFSDFARAGYEVLRTPAELERSNGSRLLGTFTRGHLPYDLDRIHQEVAAPSLADLTRKALDVLDGSDRGFVLQVEAGRIDHANHDNDPGAMVWDVLAADDALQLVLDFADRHPGTLVLVGSDHDTGGGAVFGTGSFYSGSDAAFDRITLRRSSQEYALSRLPRGASAGEVSEVLATTMGIRLTPADATRAAEVLAEQLPVAHPRAHGRDRMRLLHFLLTTRDTGDEPALNFNYATGAHTAAIVPVAAYGAGVNREPLGMVENTDLFGWMAAAIGVDFENEG